MSWFLQPNFCGSKLNYYVLFVAIVVLILLLLLLYWDRQNYDAQSWEVLRLDDFYEFTEDEDDEYVGAVGNYYVNGGDEDGDNVDDSQANGTDEDHNEQFRNMRVVLHSDCNCYCHTFCNTFVPYNADHDDDCDCLLCVPEESSVEEESEDSEERED